MVMVMVIMVMGVNYPTRSLISEPVDPKQVRSLAILRGGVEVRQEEQVRVFSIEST